MEDGIWDMGIEKVKLAGRGNGDKPDEAESTRIYFLFFGKGKRDGGSTRRCST